MKKALVFYPRFVGSQGGAKRVHHEIADVLQSEGFNVDSVSEDEINLAAINQKYDLNLGEGFQQETLRKPILLKLLEKLNAPDLLYRALESKFFARELKNRVKEYDIVFISSELWGTEIGSEVTSYIYVHQKTPDERKGTYRKIVNKITPLKIIDTDGVLCNSEFTEKNIDRDGEVVYPPINEFQFTDWEQKEDYAIMVGRIAKDKNIEEGIEIAAKAEIPLKITGFLKDREYLEELKTIAESKNIEVDFETDLEWKELKKRIEKAKFGLCTKEDEDFGMPAAEYMKAGTIPIVKDSWGLPYVVKHDELKYWGPEEAAEQIKKLREEREFRNEISEKTKERSKKFSRKNFREKIGRIVRK